MRHKQVMLPPCNLPHCNGLYAPLLASNHLYGQNHLGNLLVLSKRAEMLYMPDTMLIALEDLLGLLYF